MISKKHDTVKVYVLAHDGLAIVTTPLLLPMAKLSEKKPVMPKCAKEELILLSCTTIVGMVVTVDPTVASPMYLVTW